VNVNLETEQCTGGTVLRVIDKKSDAFDPKFSILRPEAAERIPENTR
jgi:hypothetical protein